MAAPPRRSARVLGSFAAAALAGGLSGCAGSDVEVPATSVTQGDGVSTVPVRTLVIDGRLASEAAYGEGAAVFGPPPSDARPTVQSDRLPDLYAAASPTPAPLEKYDIALAELRQVVWPGTRDGQLVWMVINHHQNELPAGTPLNSRSPHDPPSDQDTVAVFDATDGTFLVQLQGQVLVAAS